MEKDEYEYSKDTGAYSYFYSFIIKGNITYTDKYGITNKKRYEYDSAKVSNEKYVSLFPADLRWV